MGTTFKLDPSLDSDIALASQMLHGGACVAFPTETVYGLGVDATNESAVRKAFEAKGRPSDNPLIVHLHSTSQLELYCHSISDIAYRLIEEFCPGPLTIVLPRRESIASIVTAGLSSVAIRFPSHSVAQRLLRKCELPIAAPSANRSGRPSATTWQAVLEDLEGRIDGVLCDEPCLIGIESTVVDVTHNIPIVLRSGRVSIEQLRKVSSNIRLNQHANDALANSPGLRHKHYQPSAKVILIEDVLLGQAFAGSDPAVSEAYIGISRLSRMDEQRFLRIQYCQSVDDYAARLFSYFRECDAIGIEAIHCESVNENGIGRALMDRLRRASD